MDILYLAPGSGDLYYCENCYRDGLIAKALCSLHHDCVVLPIYLPLSSSFMSGLAREDHLHKYNPLFLNAIRVYLRTRFPFFRRIPQRFAKLFDYPFFLKLVAKQSNKVQANSLGDMTVSVLQGEKGPIKEEIDYILQFLDQINTTPEVLHFSTPLLLGLWPSLKAKYPQSIAVCTIQDDLEWIEGMPVDYQNQVLNLMKGYLFQIDGLVTFSHEYAQSFSQRTGYPMDKIFIIPFPLDIDSYPHRENLPDPPVIGYLSRICPQYGFDLLVQAFIKLKEDSRFAQVRLRVTGGQLRSDTTFFESMRKRLGEHQLLSQVEFLPNLSDHDRIHFLSTLSVLCVPVRSPLAFGAFLAEANAAGVPVLMPNFPVFREFIERTKGGDLFLPGSVDDLVKILQEWLEDPIRMNLLGMRGRENIRAYHNLHHAGTALITVYRTLQQKIQ